MTKNRNYGDQEVLRMKENFETGRLSRRDFMQGLLATGFSGNRSVNGIA